VELITAPHYKNRLVVQHYGKMTMQSAMNTQAPTVGKLSRDQGQDHLIESLGRVFVATSMYFDKPLNTPEAEIVAVEILNDYEMSNLKLEDIVVVIKEIKESEIYGRLTANKIIKHIRGYWERRLKAAVSDSIDNSQANKDGAEMTERVKKTVAIAAAQLNRVDYTRNQTKKYLK
jgi:hypothetical protein